MSFYMATTKINPDKTAAEITALLGRKGAKSILTEYECGEIVALSFLIEREGKEIPFRLPLRWGNCLEAMKRDRIPRAIYCGTIKPRERHGGSSSDG
jgi:hypothetical protein